MNEKKQKRIRTILLNFINQELLKNKRSKKSNLLINSLTLEELENKNMQCKDFYIKEKDKIYQNVDNGWIMGLNIYINNVDNNNPYIQSLAKIIKDDNILKNIKNKSDVNLGKINNSEEPRKILIERKSNEITYIQKEVDVGSPIQSTLLIKKELGELKLKKNNHEINSDKMLLSHSKSFYLNDTLDNERVKEKKIEKKISNFVNNLSDELILTKQLSNETLETEISKIIRLCHDYKYTNSFDKFPSDSKISMLSKEIKIAKIYAKKLKCYCRTLKKKYSIYNEIKSKQIERGKSVIINELMDNFKEGKHAKEKNDKNKSSKKAISKTRENKDEKKLMKNTNYMKLMSKKKIAESKNVKYESNRIKQLKKIENNKKNPQVNFTTNNAHMIIEDKTNKKVINLKKKRKKTMEEENNSKPKDKTNKDLKETTKSPSKTKKKSKEKTRNNRNHKTMTELYLKTDSLKRLRVALNHKRNAKENLRTKLKHLSSVEIDKGKKKHLNAFLYKHNRMKRGSIDKKINLTGFEQLNFLKIKNRSSQEQFFSNRKKKLKTLTKEHTATSLFKEKNPSTEKAKLNLKQNSRNKIPSHFRNTKDEKKKTYAMTKRRRISAVIEALKKMKKRKSTNFNDNNYYKKKRPLSPINKDRDQQKGNMSNNVDSKKFYKFSKKSKHKASNDIKEFNNYEEEKDNKETDIFNLMDDFLYKRKLERRKNAI